MRSRNRGILKKEMGWGASVIAKLVPDLRETLPGFEILPRLQDPSAALYANRFIVNAEPPSP